MSKNDTIKAGEESVNETRLKMSDKLITKLQSIQKDQDTVKAQFDIAINHLIDGYLIDKEHPSGPITIDKTTNELVWKG